MRRSSLENIDVAIDRVISSEYDEVKIVSDNIDDIVNAASGLDAVTTVNTYIDDVKLAASIKDSVVELADRKEVLDSLYADKIVLDSVYRSLAAIDSVNLDSEAINSVYTDKLILDSLYADKAKLDSLFNDKNKLDSIFSDKEVLDSLYSDKAVLDSLYNDKSTLDRVHASISNIDRVFLSSDNIDSITPHTDNIDTVANSIGSVNTTAAIDAEVVIVANNTTDISTLADDIDKINEIYTNRAEIYDANDNASIATAKASEASTSASEALGSANNASTSESNASASANVASTQAGISISKASEASDSADDAAQSEGVASTKATEASQSAANAAISENNAKDSENAASASESNALSSESNAASSETNAAASASTALSAKNDAESARLAVETIYDTFDDRFLGTKTVDPTVDNDRGSLIDGALYFNTSSNAMKVYDTGTTTWYQLPQVYLSALLDVEVSSISTGDVMKWNGTKWINHSLTKSDVGLSNVDNTSDANKPVSTATQTALDTKAASSGVYTRTATDSLLDTKANSADVYTQAELAQSVGRINSPMLHLPLKDSLAYSVGSGYINYECDTTSTYIDKYGVLQYADIDEARFEKNGLLIEGESTNLFTHSNNFTHPEWGEATNSLQSGVESPDGLNNGTLVTTVHTNSCAIYKPIIFSSAGDKTFSIFVKPNTAYTLALRFVSYDSAYTCNFDLLSKSSSLSTGKVEELANGWFRCSFTGNLSGSDLVGKMYSYIATNVGSSYASDIGNSMYIYGYQIEEMPFATSYIPTTDTPVTRGGNRCWIDQKGNEPFFNTLSPNVSISVDTDVLGSNTPVGNSSRFILTQYTGSSRYWYVRRYTIDGRVGFVSEDGENNVSYSRVDSDGSITERRSMFVFNGDNMRIFTDGVLDSTTTINPLSVAVAGEQSDKVIYIGANGTGSNNFLYGHISNVRIWDKALTDTEGAMA